MIFMKRNKQSATEPTIGSEGSIPSDQAKSKIEDNGQAPGIDEFDPESLRIDQAYLAKGGTAKKLLTVVPVRKPNSQAFIRVHPDEAYRLNVALIELQEDRETYLLKPGLAEQLTDTEYHFETLYLAITRQKTVFLWPVKLPTPDGRQNEWHISAREAAEHAMERWVRVKPNMELRAYEIFEAAGNIPEPVWPEMPFGALIRLAFKNFYVDKLDHPVIKRLQGEI